MCFLLTKDFYPLETLCLSIVNILSGLSRLFSQLNRIVYVLRFELQTNPEDAFQFLGKQDMDQGKYDILVKGRNV